jgi:phage tail tape-measure protein
LRIQQHGHANHANHANHSIPGYNRGGNSHNRSGSHGRRSGNYRGTSRDQCRCWDEYRHDRSECGDNSSVEPDSRGCIGDRSDEHQRDLNGGQVLRALHEAESEPAA